jgi:hypothetical protein
LIGLEAGLRRVLGDLSALGSKCAVVGGIAVGAHTIPRFTRDVDLAVAVADDRSAEALVASLMQRGYRVLAVLEHRDTKRLATARMLLPAEPDAATEAPVVDLLFASSGIEAEIVQKARPEKVLSGLSVAVARSGHLIALKLLSEDDRRIQDRVDVVELLKRADAAELELAHEAIAAIAGRGFGRSKDLPRLLDYYAGIAALPPDPTFIPRAVPPAPPQ